MGVLNKEKVAYAVQGFIMFLNISKDVQDMNQSAIDAIKEKSLNLFARLQSGESEPVASAFELNSLIEEVNQTLGAPYPTILGDSEENFVKGEIVAFEHYLKQELKANHLSVQQEGPLFNDSLSLWEKVGVSLSAEEGTSEFLTLISKLNSMLPDEEKYPIPDPNEWNQ